MIEPRKRRADRTLRKFLRFAKRRADRLSQTRRLALETWDAFQDVEALEDLLGPDRVPKDIKQTMRVQRIMPKDCRPPAHRPGDKEVADARVHFMDKGKEAGSG